MRIGVNSGSLPKHLHELEREAPVEALVAAAVEFVELMEGLDFEDFKVSIKSTNVPNTIAANRLLAEKVPYPLHLGITEAGTKWSGSLKSAVGLGTLLADGIGDTIRISLSTFHAEEEVKVAWEILKALQLRERGPVLIACPTCGRLQFDMDSVVAEIEQRLESYAEPVEVAVLGCAVNGIGEASHADFGIAGAKNEGLIFAHGKPLRKVPQDDLVDTLFEEIDKSLDRGKVEVDEAESREGAAWLAKIEEENAGELTPEKIAQMEKEAVEKGSRTGCCSTRRLRRRRDADSPGATEAPAGGYRLGTSPRGARPRSRSLRPRGPAWCRPLEQGIGFLGDATLAGVSSHAQGCAGGCGGDVAQADGAGGADSAAGGRAVDVSAGRVGGCSGRSRRSSARRWRRSGVRRC